MIKYKWGDKDIMGPAPGQQNSIDRHRTKDFPCFEHGIGHDNQAVPNKALLVPKNRLVAPKIPYDAATADSLPK